jgi:fructan beta-fructosidase
MKNLFWVWSLIILAISCKVEPKEDAEEMALEPYRPYIHFTPKSGWMNDPNGMVFHNGVYHLFYQHYPDSTVWGPMHWGHATSTDLFHWDEQPIKLYPDSLGYIFSGSAVSDSLNTSGFGKDGKTPLIAIFTHHKIENENDGTNTHENQSIAYSLDDGATWTKYEWNPVLKNPGHRDFRDPKVMWHEASKKWIMTLAVGDRIMFYASPNLKDWQKASEFGEKFGAHGGVWECPDLFPLSHEGKTVWVLIVNLNPGGPNGGSGTQYFLGDFDGSTFKPYSTATKWLDYGPDNYAGITWSNTGDRKILLGWMSNWLYANQVPTKKWRSAMTIARDLRLQKVNDDLHLTCLPVSEIDNIIGERNLVENVKVKGTIDLTEDLGGFKPPFLLEMELDSANDFQLIFSNNAGEQIILGYDKASNQYFIDRTKSGDTTFHKAFAGKHIAPRISNSGSIKFSLVADVSSLELFADNGLTAMTSIFFNEAGFNKIAIQSAEGVTIQKGGIFSLAGKK